LKNRRKTTRTGENVKAKRLNKNKKEFFIKEAKFPQYN
jgi:hypothetical protein